MNGSPCNRFKEGKKCYIMMLSAYFIYSDLALAMWLKTTQIARKETRCHHFMGYSF